MDKVFNFNSNKKNVKEDGDYIYVGKRRYTKAGYAKLCENLAKAREARKANGKNYKKKSYSKNNNSNELEELKKQIELMKNPQKAEPVKQEKSELEILREELKQLKMQRQKEQEEQEYNNLKLELEQLKNKDLEPKYTDEPKNGVLQPKEPEPEPEPEQEPEQEDINPYDAVEYFKNFNMGYEGLKMVL